MSGDRLLASDHASQKWAKPQDVNTNLYYPQTGVGGVITYLEINVEQVNKFPHGTNSLFLIMWLANETHLNISKEY